MDECQQAGPSIVEIKVVKSSCHLMAEGSRLILEGPCISYEKSGPVCVTALNAIYPWVMLTRFAVKTPALDYDNENQCYHATCPCGTVSYDIRKL